MLALIVILAAITVAVVVGFILLLYGEDGYGTRHLFAGVSGVLIMIASGIAAVSYALMAWSWIAADSKAQIINREYGTDYTREEVFFASDVIDTIREIDRKRIEVNGDLLRENKD